MSRILTARTIEEAIEKYPQDAERELQRLNFEEKMVDFVAGAWKYIDPNPYKFGWHLEAIAEHLQAVTRGEIKRLVINVPPRTSKSSMVSVCFPAWTWAQSAKGPLSGPHVQFLYASYAQSLSIRDSTKTRRLLESPWYQKYWGDKFQITSDQNTKVRFDNNKGGYRLSTSVDGALTGEGGSIIVCFPYDEIVWTEHGPRKIGDLVKSKLKIKVWSHNFEKNCAELKPVIGWHKNPGRTVVELCLSDGKSLRCTEDHELLTENGYVKAGSLSIGDNILSYSGGMIVASRPITGQTMPFSNTAPSFAASNLLYGSNFNAIPFCKVSRAVGAFSYFNRFFARQNGSGALFQNWKSSMFFSIFNVFRSGAISKVFQSAVGRIAVNMPNIGILRSFAQKSVSDQNVNSYRKTFAIMPNVATGISFAQRGFQNSWFNWSPSVNSAIKHISGFASNTSKIGNGIIGRNMSGSPNFIRVINIIHHDSPESTYCISVKDNSNMLAGQSMIIASNCDDPHNANEVESDLVRQGTLEWWDQSMSTRLNDPKTGAYIVIMQRLHESDLTGHVLSKDTGNWVHLCLPMRFEPDRRCITPWYTDTRDEGELLVEERFGEAEVKELEGKLGPFAAAGQLQQRPKPKGGGIIKREWWTLWDETVSMGEGLRKSVFPPFEYVIASLDTAYTTKQENDYSAMTIWGVWIDRQGNQRIMLVYAWQDRLEFPKLVKKTLEVSNKFKIDKLLIESKAAGISVAQELRTHFAKENWGIQLVDPGRGDKVARTYAIQHLFSEGMIYAPDMDWAEKVIEQAESFPKAVHDDLVDSMTQALLHLRVIGFAQKPVEIVAEKTEGMLYKGSRTTPLYPV